MEPVAKKPKLNFNFSSTSTSASTSTSTQFNSNVEVEIDEVTTSLTGTHIEGDMNVFGDAITTFNITKREESTSIVTSFRLINSATPNFCGRKDLLHLIHNLMRQCSLKTTYNERIIVIHGLGGMGKSEIARKYSEIYINDPIIQNVAWIDSETETSLKSSLVSIANSFNLKIPSRDEDRNVEQIAKDVYQHFSDHIGTGLFIFDNSVQMKNTDKYFGIFKFLPIQILRRLPLILITARSSEWQIPKENIIGITELSDDDSVELLTKTLSLTETQLENIVHMKSIRKLASALQGYPLGLTLAVSNIDNEDWNDLNEEIENYMERMQGTKSEGQGGWIDDQFSDGAATNYSLIMSNVWRATFDKIKNLGQIGEDSLRLLNLMAYMPPDQIFLTGVEEKFEFVFGKKVPKHCFSILVKFSLISIHRKDNNPKWLQIRIHRLVQHCTRDRLQVENDYSYLTRYCLFLSQPKMVVFGSGTSCTILDAKYMSMWLKNYWKSDPVCIQLSIVFIPLLIEQKQEEAAWNDFLELYHFFKSINKLCFQIEPQDVMGNVVNSFYLCLSYFKYHKLDKYRNHEIFQDSELSQETLQMGAMAGFKLYFEHLLLPDDSISTNSTGSSNEVLSKALQKYCKGMCQRILKEDLFFLANNELRKEPLDLLVSLINSFGIGRLDTVREIYGLLGQYNYRNNDDKSSSTLYWSAILKIHTQIYPTIDLNSQKQMREYWERGGPINYYCISERLAKDNYGDWSKMFADSFVVNGGIYIFCQHLHYVSAYDRHPMNLNQMFDLIIRLAYSLNLSNQIIQCEYFMKHFYSFTVEYLLMEERYSNPGNAYYIHTQMPCLLVWFALFSRIESCTDASGCQWSIRSVVEQLKAFLLHGSQRLNDYLNYSRGYEFRLCEEIPACLHTFIQFSNGIDNQETKVAIEVAGLMLKIIKSRDSTLTQHSSSSSGLSELWLKF